MKKSTHLLIATILAGCITSCSSGKRIAQHRIVTNPMNLNYRFQPKDESRREAADPVLEYFKGYYYLFASKSGGYWRSEDLADWEYIPYPNIPNTYTPYRPHHYKKPGREAGRSVWCPQPPKYLFPDGHF